MFVISVNPGNLIQKEVQANMNSGGKVELDMHAPPTIRKMWIPAGGILLFKVLSGWFRFCLGWLSSVRLTWSGFGLGLACLLARSLARLLPSGV